MVGSFVFDFPGVTGQVDRLVFSHPDRVIRADSLDDVLPAIADAEAEAMAGKWVAGLVSYDAAPAMDAALRVPGKAPAVPLALFCVFESPDPGAALEEPGGIPGFEWTPLEPRADYDAAIADIRERIARGDVYQVNHTIRLRASAPKRLDWNHLYDGLRAAQGARYTALLDLGDSIVASLSPELFFERRGTRIETRPMKGTARRGRWSAEDRAAGDALRDSEKDRSENVMIVDLLRNDLGRVCVPGTVDVPELFALERYPTLWQMTSTVVGELAAGTRLIDVFTSLFPCGSVTGAPKIAAAACIAELERSPRGAYCGTVGLIRPGGDCTFNVAIRTLTHDVRAGRVEYGAGGGITWDSAPTAEYDEIAAKAAFLRGAPPPFELIETMRVDDGSVVRLERHLARLRASAEYFGFADPTSSARVTIAAHLMAAPDDARRLRLLADHRGRVRLDSAPLPDWEEVVRFAVGAEPVSSADVFLYHKTTNRGVYDRARAANAAADDVLLYNERGEITEFTIGNVVVELDRRRVTPPIHCGLLPGTLRAELVENGIVEERVVRLDDLGRATGIWRVNSLREWNAAERIGATPIPVSSPPAR